MNPKPGWRRNMEHSAIAQHAARMLVARMLVAGAASLATMSILNPRVVPGALRWAVCETWRDGIREERARARSAP